MFNRQLELSVRPGDARSDNDDGPLGGAAIFSGLSHGINPWIGWPLAISAALMERSHQALPKVSGMLALWHFHGDDRDSPAHIADNLLR